MDQTLSLLLVFSGLSILPSCLPHQFHFVNMKKTWTEAQNICRQNYTDLATIDEDMADMKKLNQNATNKYILITEYKSWSDAHSYCQQYHTDLASVRNTTERDAIKSILPDINGIYRVWIGLKKSLGVWRWSDQSGSSFKSWETFKANMADGSYQDGEFCGEVTFSSGKWKYQDCTTNSNFICYDDELVLVSENKTWSEALWHCRDLDMELVSVHNQNIQHWVQQRAKKASTPFVWLGLRYTCTLDFWFWVNGEESCYHNWSDGEGYDTIKEQCGNTGAIQRDGGQWVGKSETERFNFICSNSTGEM
ncbi:lymphocyte antigen 75-like [Salvelinus namaycush]|uniref:Lymphocyte antigen 75-like n=1 Tax=Salvelinus namaycush TaxID=8040 RepID=A0A8U0P9M5_SALNM|nr:lymphocyte antigen 75-like [Salvelinus namaycush]